MTFFFNEILDFCIWELETFTVEFNDKLNLMKQFSLRCFELFGTFPPFFENHRYFLQLVAFDWQIKISEFYTFGIKLKGQLF